MFGNGKLEKRSILPYMQITYKKIRESTELVDGVFWGFDPVGGFDIDMFIEDNRITELQNAKIIRVNNSPYAAEFNLFNYTYYTEKYCPFDNQLLPKTLKNDKELLIEMQKLLEEKIFSFTW
jgi:hypothetical protein